MTIKATIIEDSMSLSGIRLTTFELLYPRFIHSEFMTHRVTSRNASSSRAIPVKRQMQMIRMDPAATIHWGANQPGMQANAQLSGWRLSLTKFAWYGAMYAVLGFSKLALFAGAHKQVVNRMLEPWSHIKVVATGTDWENFFSLRDHPDAEPNINQLASLMRARLRLNNPRPVAYNEWHLPYITEEEREQNEIVGDLVRVSVARCARVSYFDHAGNKPSYEDDLKLYQRLVGSTPLHASPTEHQALPDRKDLGGNWESPQLHGNFRGWMQNRKFIPGEVALETNK